MSLDPEETQGVTRGDFNSMLDVLEESIEIDIEKALDEVRSKNIGIAEDPNSSNLTEGD